MPRNEIDVAASPAAVWEVLADPRLYGNWVVGASSTRAVEGRWPDPGAVLHHSQMLFIRDTTSVLESVPERRLVLEARARPLIVARVDLRLEPDGDGTHLVLDEEPIGGLGGMFPSALLAPQLYLRNKVAVKRLRRLAEIGVQLGEAPA
jgi:uncharacterized protein YndB with AHSA1/START domain